MTLSLRIEGSEEELQKSGNALLQRLAAVLRTSAPGTAELLEKALAQGDTEEDTALRNPAMRMVQEKWRRAFRIQSELLVDDVLGILERG